MMVFYKNPSDSLVYAYDEDDPAQQELIQNAIDNGWENVTGSWPPPPSEETLLLECKSKASALLYDTDWTQIPDCPLVNKQEFFDWRAIIRNYALNPVTDPVFPPKPASVWPPAK